MKILIQNNPVVTGGSGEAASYRNSIESIAGKWVDVDTECLFDNQYNLFDPPLRIHEKDIKAILADARIGRMKCRNCGTTQVLSNCCIKGCHRKWLHPFKQNKEFKTFIYKFQETLTLFWNRRQGWVSEKAKASRFTLKDILIIDPPIMFTEVIPTKRLSNDS